MKTLMCYHNRDLDGWMSAAIVKHWFIKNTEECVIHDTNSISIMYKGIIREMPMLSNIDISELYFLGYDYGDPIPDVSGYDRIIMSDISFPPEKMQAISDDFEGDNFIWCDHHISAIKDNEDLHYVHGIRDTKFSACELTWMHFFPTVSSASQWDGMPEIVRLLGRYDCFGHKGTSEETKVLEFQYGARQVISNMDQAYEYLKVCDNYSNRDKNYEQEHFIWEQGKAIYSYLCTDAKRIYQRGFAITLNEPNMGDVGLGDYFERKFVCINQGNFNPVNFGINYHLAEFGGYDGVACFHLGKDKIWSFSLYSENDVDVSIIAKGFSGGGHKNAAGMRLTTEQFLKLIK